MEPPNKKHKIDSALIETIDKYINKLKKCQNLRAILSDDLDKPLPMMKVYVGQVSDPKFISQAILVLNKKLPLKDMNHLKRVRSRHVILCPSDCLDGTSIQDYLERNVPEIKDIFIYFKEVDVPSVAPKLRKQLLPSWSFNFHPNDYLERLTSNKFFNFKDMTKHIIYMEICFHVAKYYIQQTDLQELDLLEHNATIVVDPSINMVVAAAFCNKNHPIQHSAMLAIDNVAKTQFGGVWGETSQELIDCTFKGFDEQLLKYLKDVSPPVKYGARAYRRKGDCTAIDNTGSNNQETSLKGPYLCTDYNIYMLREPCLMCAMALVHARVKRIFFCFDNPVSGAVKSRTKLQAVPALNHHFEVFTGFLGETVGMPRTVTGLDDTW